MRVVDWHVSRRVGERGLTLNGSLPSGRSTPSSGSDTQEGANGKAGPGGVGTSAW